MTLLLPPPGSHHSWLMLPKLSKTKRSVGMWLRRVSVYLKIPSERKPEWLFGDESVGQTDQSPEFGSSEPGLTTRIGEASVALAHPIDMGGRGGSSDSHRPDSLAYAAKEKQGPTPKAVP